MNKISIIIPQYKESDHMVSELLSSINIQTGIDFNKLEIIIVNDGSDMILSDKMLNSFSNIKPIYLKLEKNVGPGLARQAGLDISNGNYIMFSDADDIYQNAQVLELIFENIQYQPDWIKLAILRQSISKETGKTSYDKIFRDMTWLHGKIFKKSIIDDHNIRFSDKILYQEDSLFIACFSAHASKPVEIDYIASIWRNNTESITSKNDGIFARARWYEFVKSSRLALDYLVQNGFVQEAIKKVGWISVQVYYKIMRNDGIWEPQHINSTINEYKQIISKYGGLFDICEDIAEYLTIEKQNEPYVIEKETFPDFIKRMRS